MRIVAALMFMQHGAQKIFGFPPPAGPQPAFVLASLIGVAGLLELLGGAALLCGLFTRPMAFLLSGEMAVAYFMKHAPVSPFPIANRGELAVMFSFIFLYFAFAGGGAWSLDAILARSSRKKQMRTIAMPERRIGPRREEDRRRAS